MRQTGEAKLRILFTDIDDAEQPGTVHGYGGRPRGAGHVHAQPGHKHQVQYNIHGTGDDQEQQRRIAVSHPPQNSRVHIISHIPESSEENNADIGVGELPRIIGHLHEPQNRRPGKLSDYRQWDGAQKQKGNGGCPDLLQAFRVTAPGKL